MDQKAGLSPGEGTAEPTPICAIGASAGGVQALREFFRHVPKDLGLAYVVIIHLSPDHPSAMVEILSNVTEMPVNQATDTPRLEPNCIHVIPPDRELVIEGDDVHARPFTEPRGRRAPIDMFFRSIAAARGDGLAIVMSGAGSDGATGVRAVKEAGGVIFVQDPAEAEYPMMPRSAIATGAADFVAPITRLVERVMEVTQSKKAVRAIAAEGSEQEVRRIMNFIRARTGHDFSSYKQATTMRRLSRRMQVTRVESIKDYADYLVANAEEAQQLFNDLLISVTSFFRDSTAWEALARDAVAPLFERAGEDGIRAWVAGCATGEEAYSLAIVMLEEAHRRHVSTPIQIFATDLDEGALATAREGRYPASIEADVSEERLKRWFVLEGSHNRVAKELRDAVLFASHSVLKDPPFMRLDLISCRNLLIYMERDLQRQVCTLFHYGLRPNGFLFLGSAETVESTRDTYVTVNRDARLYRAREIARRDLPVLPHLPTQKGWPPNSVRRASDRRDKREREGERGIGADHAATLERTAPPSALVDHNNTILHLSGSAGRFLLAAGGPFSPDIVEQVRPELRLDLAGALRRAIDGGEATLTPPLSVAFNGTARRVILSVAPVLDEKDAPVRRAIVYFLDGGPDLHKDARDASDAGEIQSRRLREELRLAEERLNVARHEHENAIQDLRIANEELQSINEEYRSTSEELETSKEELQSMNEELQTVNSELKLKLESISSAHNDLRNLITSAEIGTLFLDPELRIRMFTPAVTQFFSVTESDVGRRITDFTHRLRHGGLEVAAAQVLRRLVPHEEEVSTNDGRWLMVRLRPYRTVDDRIEGLVVTFVDVTARKTAEHALAVELRAMDRLQELATRAFEAEMLEPPLLEVLDAAMDLLHADSGNIQCYDDDGNATLAVLRGLPKEYVDAFVEFDKYPAVSARVAERRQLTVEDAERETSLKPALDVFRKAGIRAFQSMPLQTSDGALVGMLSLHFREPRTFSDHDLRLLAICARPAADAIKVHQLQEKLRASEGRLRKVLETDTVAVLFFDDEGVLVDSNDAFLKMSGYTREQVERRELHWRTMRPAEDVGSTEHRMNVFAETGRLEPYETEYVLADGSRRWFLFAGRSVEPGLLVKYAIDVSDRKKAEERYRLLFDSIDEGFCVIEVFFDANGKPVDYRFLEVNTAFEKQTGLKGVEGAAARSLVPETEEHWFETYGRIAMTRQPERSELAAEALGAHYEVYAFPFGPPEAMQVGVLFRNVIDRKRAEAERELLSRELSHRVKNSLAVVQALARQTQASSVAAFREVFGGRLTALARAHSLLLETDWQSADLGTLVEDTTAAYRVEDRIKIVGARVSVSAKQALALSLVLHELGTNALKHGALSVDGGSVAIAWTEDEDRSIRLSWREVGGPDAKEGDGGFGTRLIRRVVEHDLRGTVDMEFAADGLRCAVVFPRDEPAASVGPERP